MGDFSAWDFLSLHTLLGAFGWAIGSAMAIHGLHLASAHKWRSWMYIAVCSIAFIATFIDGAIQHRDARNQSVQQGVSDKQIQDLKNTIESQGKDLQVMSASQQAEIARRQQAEKDLQLYIAGVGKLTRQGVAQDIREAPIQVQVNGQPTRNPNDLKRVREALGSYMLQASQLRDRCRAGISSDLKLQGDAEAWYSDVQTYLKTNLDSSFVSQFVTQRASSFSPNGVPDNTTNLWIFLDQRIETLSRFIDQLKQG